MKHLFAYDLYTKTLKFFTIFLNIDLVRFFHDLPIVFFEILLMIFSPAIEKIDKFLKNSDLNEKNLECFNLFPPKTEKRLLKNICKEK